MDCIIFPRIPRAREHHRMKFFAEAYHRPSQECGLPDFNVLNRVFDRFPAIHGGKNLPPRPPGAAGRRSQRSSGTV